MRMLRSQDEITASWGNDFGLPLVSICCTAYNHEQFIEDALEGFLAQRTDFCFEIVVHDDASTDRTADIIRSFEAKYPKIIRAIYQSTNQYSQGMRAFMILAPFCKGKYLAICEGDDFWTDPDKLQTQATFLEKNPAYVVSGHDAFLVDVKGSVLKRSCLSERHKRDTSGESLIKAEVFMPTASRMQRNITLELIPERQMVVNGDRFILSLLGFYGKYHYHSDIKPAAYRVHSGGVWSMLDEAGKLEASMVTWYWMYRYYGRVGKTEYAKFYWLKYLRLVLSRTPFSTLTRAYLLRTLLSQNIKKYLRKILFLFTKHRHG